MLGSTLVVRVSLLVEPDSELVVVLGATYVKLASCSVLSEDERDIRNHVTPAMTARSTIRAMIRMLPERAGRSGPSLFGGAQGLLLVTQGTPLRRGDGHGFRRKTCHTLAVLAL